MADFFDQVNLRSVEKREKEAYATLINDLINLTNWDRDENNSQIYYFYDHNDALKKLNLPLLKMKEIIYKNFNERKLINYYRKENTDTFVFEIEPTLYEQKMAKLLVELASAIKSWGLNEGRFEDRNQTLRDLQIPFEKMKEIMLLHFGKHLTEYKWFSGYDTYYVFRYQ